MRRIRILLAIVLSGFAVDEAAAYNATLSAAGSPASPIEYHGRSSKLCEYVADKLTTSTVPSGLVTLRRI
jgi:hypothetical protein